MSYGSWINYALYSEAQKGIWSWNIPEEYETKVNPHGDVEGKNEVSSK